VSCYGSNQENIQKEDIKEEDFDHEGEGFFKEKAPRQRGIQV